MTREERTARVVMRLAAQAGAEHARFYLHTIDVLLAEIDRLRGTRREAWAACQDRKRASGRCIGCGGKSGERWYCRACRIRRSAMDKQRRAA